METILPKISRTLYVKPWCAAARQTKRFLVIVASTSSSCQKHSLFTVILSVLQKSIKRGNRMHRPLKALGRVLNMASSVGVFFSSTLQPKELLALAVLRRKESGLLCWFMVLSGAVGEDLVCKLDHMGGKVKGKNRLMKAAAPAEKKNRVWHQRKSRPIYSRSQEHPATSYETMPDIHKAFTRNSLFAESCSCPGGQ